MWYEGVTSTGIAMRSRKKTQFPDAATAQLQRLQKKKVLPTEGNLIYQGAHRPAIWTRRLKFHTYMISLQNYAGSRQQSY